MNNESTGQAAAQDVQVAEAKPDVSIKEASSSSAPANTQPAGAVNSDAGTVVPYGKDPEITKFIDRQISKREQAFKGELQKLKDDYVKRLEDINSNRSAAGKSEVNQLPPEEEQAIMLLAEKLLGHKAVREKYGLSKVDQLEKQITTSSSEAEKQVFESEMGTSLDKYSTQFGYDKDELRENIEEFIASDPWFADKSFHKGSLDKAFKLYFSDKSQELADRASNLKLIKEQKEKKQAGTESTSTGKKAPGAVKNEKFDDFLERRAREEGGIKFD